MLFNLIQVTEFDSLPTILKSNSSEAKSTILAHMYIQLRGLTVEY